MVLYIQDIPVSIDTLPEAEIVQRRTPNVAGAMISPKISMNNYTHLQAPRKDPGVPVTDRLLQLEPDFLSSFLSEPSDSFLSDSPVELSPSEFLWFMSLCHADLMKPSPFDESSEVASDEL